MTERDDRIDEPRDDERTDEPRDDERTEPLEARGDDPTEPLDERGPLFRDEDAVEFGYDGAPPAAVAGHAASRTDLTSLIGGVCLAALGALLLLETEDVIDLSLGYVWPALLAVAGVTLLASGIRKGRN